MSWFFGLGISMSGYICLHGLFFVFIVKIKKIIQNILNYAEEYPNLCNSYRYKACTKIVNKILRIINRIGIINKFYSLVTLHNQSPHLKVPRRKSV